MAARALILCFSLFILATKTAAQTVDVTISVVGLTATEGSDGFLCVIIQDGETNGRTFEVEYSTSSGDALEGVDYTATNGIVVLSDATMNNFECIPVPTIEDDINEVNECLNVMIQPVGTQPNLVILTDTDQLCINDNDVATVGVQMTSREVDEDVGSINLCVEADDVAEDFNVNYFTTNGGAIAGSDYTEATGTFSFSVANRILCAQVTIINDGDVEGRECFTFQIQVSADDATLTDDTTEVCIRANDAQTTTRVFGFTQTNYQVDENVAPTPGFQVCVRLTQGTLASGEVAAFEVTLAGGTATLGVDFGQVDPNPFPIQFNSGNQDDAQCAPVPILNDLIYEGDETFTATVTNTATSNINVMLNPSLTTVTIVEDDPMPMDDMMDMMGPSIGDDPHFAIFLPSGKLLCYTVQGEHSFAFNLISNDKLHMNALFVPDSRREEVTWIGSLGIVVQDIHFLGSNTTKIRFDSKVNQIHINDKMALEAKNIAALTFKNGKLLISEGPIIEEFHYPSVRVNLDDLGMGFTVNFTGEHLDMMWNKLMENEDSHGLIGQFFRKGVEIDTAQKLLYLPGKDPVPVMRKPVWAYMEHNVPSDQLCWVAMNPGYQGSHLIDGHYLDYVVDNVLSTDFKFECKHKK